MQHGIELTPQPDSALTEPLAPGIMRLVEKNDGTMVLQFGNSIGEPVTVSGTGGGGAGTWLTVPTEAGSLNWPGVAGAAFVADDGPTAGIQLATTRVFPDDYVASGTAACVQDDPPYFTAFDPMIWAAKKITGGIRINVDTTGATGDGVLVIHLP